MSTMKINARLIASLRKKKSWSQEELATASGLNLRTIQRIESDGAASLQSRKALASVFEMEVGELEIEEQPMMKRYEYKAVPFKMRMMGMAQGKTADAVTAALNQEAAQGWRCVSLVPDSNVAKLWALLERETTR
jgi:transcriptional regulator with XRE-family HTH domain